MSSIIQEKNTLKKGKRLYLYCEVEEDEGTEVSILLGKVLSIQEKSGRTLIKVPKKDLECWQPPNRPVLEEKEI